MLEVSAVDISGKHSMTLSPNLTTHSVTSIVNFETLEAGDTNLPNNTITDIKTSIPGLLSVNNIIARIAGRLQEADTELRASYLAKIFRRSSRMNDSIKAAILQNVQGVINCIVQDNPTNNVDEYGRPPHCIEAVVEGGSDTEIAQQILNTKAGGISSYGNTEIDLILNSGETLTIRFTRPSYIYVWFQVEITPMGNLPGNYFDIIKTAICTEMSELGTVDEFTPQKFIGNIYRQIQNIAHVEISAFCSDNPNETPTVYTQAPVYISFRQRAVTDTSRIEVVLSG
jgi:uncharacterized phage protein gp47/JayE